MRGWSQGEAWLGPSLAGHERHRSADAAIVNAVELPEVFCQSMGYRECGMVRQMPLDGKP
jgi:hypothetical protein